MSKLTITKGKYEHLRRLSNENHVIGALAIDQRGSLKKMIAAGNPDQTGDEGIIHFKELISEGNINYANELLLEKYALIIKADKFIFHLPENIIKIKSGIYVVNAIIKDIEYLLPLKRNSS